MYSTLYNIDNDITAIIIFKYVQVTFITIIDHQLLPNHINTRNEKCYLKCILNVQVLYVHLRKWQTIYVQTMKNTRYCLFDDVLYFQIKCHTLKERKQTAKCHLTCNKSAYLDRLAMKEMIMDLHYCIEARSIKHFSPNLCSLFFAYENRISLNHWLRVS